MYTDETLTELQRLRGSGDSTIWTGMYLASQALRYMATGDEEAREEVLRLKLGGVASKPPPKGSTLWKPQA